MDYLGSPNLGPTLGDRGTPILQVGGVRKELPLCSPVTCIVGSSVLGHKGDMWGPRTNKPLYWVPSMEFGSSGSRLPVTSRNRLCGRSCLGQHCWAET